MIEHQGVGLLVILMEAVGILIVERKMVGIMTAIAIGTTMMFYMV